MTTLRKMVDSQIMAGNESKPVAPLKAGDQVLIRRKSGVQNKSVNEIMAGTLVSLNGEQATVTMPRPGGRILRATVPLDSLTPASSMFKRSRIQMNPAFRNISVSR